MGLFHLLFGNSNKKENNKSIIDESDSFKQRKETNLTELENLIDSEEDDYKDYYPFEKVMDKMKNLLGIEVFETIGKHAGFIVNDDSEIDQNSLPSQEQLIDNLFNLYRRIYVFCKVITKLEKLELSKVINDIIFNSEGKLPDWVNKVSLSSKTLLQLLFNLSEYPKKNTAAYEDFEEDEIDKGLVKSSEAIFLWFLEDSNESAIYNQDISSILDTFGYGLFLKEEYKASVTIHNKSIELYPNHLYVAEHLTNRGKSKLKLDDKKGAKLDFEKALEKDKNFEEAKKLFKILNQSNEKDVVFKDDEIENITEESKVNANTKKSTYDNGNILEEWDENGDFITQVAEDDTTASINDESNIENPNTETVLYRKDMSGLKLYFEKMKNMERLFSELTNAIRNGSSVKQYLVDANIMNNQELIRAVATGFTDISSFLKGMLETEENDELRKDYNACLEVITTLDKSEKKFIDELNNFDSKGISEKYNIEEKNLDINYWYEFILTRVNTHLKNEKLENDLDNILYENIWSHADEYGRTHENRSLEDKRIISQIRILCYGHIYVCLKNSSKNDKLSQLKSLHAKASLYGAIKFALFSGVSKEDVNEWFPSAAFDEKLITGYSPFEKLIQSFYRNNDDKSDFSEKIKIVFDKEDRIPIYELSNEMKSNSPYWFKGPFYIKDGLVESIETGNKMELSYLEKSIFTEIQFNKLLIEKLFEANIKRTDFEQPFLSYLVLVVDSGTLWLESNNKDAFNKLFNN